MIQKCDLSPDAMEVLPLFPTLVWKFSLPDDAVSRINNAVVTKADEVMGHLVPGSPRQFMQSHQKLHRDPQLAELAGFIQAGAESVLKFLALGRCPIEITGLWVNIGRPGATHKSHRHPNNFFSGTYYARVPQGAGGIQFLDPRSQSGLLSPQPERLNQHNAGKITLPVAEGDLMFWLSWFEHAVPANSSGEDRYTASFNLMFSNFTDQHTSPILQRVVDSL
ncbi:MAG: hypothetical protein JSW21_09560 [Gammaproteobacteria bacterium]|nr:MAG: hypothetical protein JSW21_09560 [Gammaproteobacteria bacterium]